MKSKIINRRNFLKFSLGTIGTAVGTKTLAEICSESSGRQPLGPFFPQEGTPVDPVREVDDKKLPIYLANDNDLTVVRGRKGQASGQVVYVKGKVLSKNCQPIPNATLIIWQASESGRYNHKGDAENHDFDHPVTGQKILRSLDDHFQSWGKATTNNNGEYEFKTIVPGFYPADLQNKWYRPPHIHFMVSATGQPQFVTQLYFRGEKLKDNAWIQELNGKDFLLQDKKLTALQRDKLIVEFKDDPSGQIQDGLVGEFNIVLGSV